MKINEIAAACGLNEEEQQEYKKYLTNQFENPKINYLHDDTFLFRWYEICGFAETHGAAEALNKFVAAKRPVNFCDPDGVRIEIYNSFAGEIPVVYIKNNSDFDAFITNVIYKGIRPENLSKTGASFASGKNTKFITLSAKPYSGIPASEMNLPEQEWLEKSMIIRREHECTHYFTKQIFGVSRNHLHDELIADFFGLLEAFGESKAEHFLKFMGLTGGSGGRLKFYTAGLSEKLCMAIEKTAESAAWYLENYSKSDEFLHMNRSQRVIKLCLTGLADMSI